MHTPSYSFQWSSRKGESSRDGAWCLQVENWNLMRFNDDGGGYGGKSSDNWPSAVAEVEDPVSAFKVREFAK